MPRGTVACGSAPWQDICGNGMEPAGWGRFLLKVEPPLREGKGREPGTPRHDHPDRPHRHRGRLLRNGARPAQAQSRCDHLYPAGRPHRRPAARRRLPGHDRSRIGAFRSRCHPCQPDISLARSHRTFSRHASDLDLSRRDDLVQRAGRPAVGPACRGRSCLSRQDRVPIGSSGGADRDPAQRRGPRRFPTPRALAAAAEAGAGPGKAFEPTRCGPRRLRATRSAVGHSRTGGRQRSRRPAGAPS